MNPHSSEKAPTAKNGHGSWNLHVVVIGSDAGRTCPIWKVSRAPHRNRARDIAVSNTTLSVLRVR